MSKNLLAMLALAFTVTALADDTPKKAAAFDVERLRVPYEKFALDNGL